MKQQTHTYITITALLAVALFLVLWNKDLLGGGALSKNGSIEITVPDSGSRVFLDNKRKQTTTENNEKVIFKHLEPRTYTLLVASEGRYPWYKAIDLSTNHDIALTSFSVPTSLASMIVPSTDPKFQSIKTVIDKGTLPTTAAKRRSTSSNVDIWVEPASNSIHAEWVGDARAMPKSFCPLTTCSNHIVAFSGKTPIRGLDFYKNRDDAVLIAIENSISAIELDISPPQNFQPIFTGNSPRFHQPENGILFIQSGEALSVVRY